MKKLIRPIPLFIILLPLFFVFHRFVENSGYISFFDCLPLMGIYLLAALLLYFLFLLILRQPGRAALISFYILSFYLFFGVLHDFLRRNAIFLHRYSLLLPLFLVSVVLLALFLRKRTSLSRITRFLNILLILYLIVDTATWAWQRAHRRPPSSLASTLADHYQGCDSCPRPDIYLLLFDEYSASRTLKDQFHYDNGGLDSFLRRENFHIVAGSHANYYKTPFSMGSMLNLSYLRGIPQPLSLQPDDYLEAIEQIHQSEAIQFLMARGYSIINNSPFDLPGHPLKIDQPFIPSSTRLITYSTLYNYFRRDVGASLDEFLHGHRSPLESDFRQVETLNDSFIDETIRDSRAKGDGPRFVYMHVMMPHLPYFYDSLLRLRPLEELNQNVWKGDPVRYVEYLPYTNSRIRQLIGEIKNNTAGKAVILFMSDHGFRYDPRDIDQPWFFNNQNAVYFPGGDYSLLYDSISAVNQFRVVFNKLFRLNLPLLRDSSIFLHDRPGSLNQQDNAIHP